MSVFFFWVFFKFRNYSWLYIQALSLSQFVKFGLTCVISQKKKEGTRSIGKNLKVSICTLVVMSTVNDEKLMICGSH